MPSYKDYIAGWINSSVRTFMEDFPRTSSRMRYALITSLDSDSQPARMLDRINGAFEFPKGTEALGGGLLIPTASMLREHAFRDLFFGFDEVWFFPERPRRPRPPGCSIVGPRRVDQRKLDVLGPWMARESCSLALADGVGLNFIVKARGLVRYLLSQSGDAPSFAGETAELSSAHN